MLTLPPLPETVRTLTTAETAFLRSRFSDLPKDLSDCPTCRGNRRFLWYTYDEISGVRQPTIAEYDCQCADQFVLNRFFLHSGIRLNYQRLQIDDYRREVPEEIADYIGNSESYVSQGIGLVLTGSIGSGKSLLAALVLKMLLMRSHDGYYTTFTEMLDTFAGGWHDKEERNWFNRRVRNAGVLCIDDVGRERKGSSIAESTFEEVIRHRVADDRPTIITTNRTMAELTSGYGWHVMSLLNESAITSTFSGPDYRDESKERMLAEVRAGITRPVLE